MTNDAGSNKKTRTKTVNGCSTFSFQDNGGQGTWDPLTQRRSRRTGHSGFTSVRLCLMLTLVGSAFCLMSPSALVSVKCGHMLIDCGTE